VRATEPAGQPCRDPSAKTRQRLQTLCVPGGVTDPPDGAPLRIRPRAPIRNAGRRRPFLFSSAAFLFVFFCSLSKLMRFSARAQRMKRITCPTGCRVRYVPQPGAAPWPPLRPPSRGRVRHLVAWQQPERSEVRGDPVPNRCTTSSPTHRRRHPSGPRHLRRPAPGTSRGETSAAVTAAPARPTRTALRRSVGLPCHPGGRTHNAVLSQVCSVVRGGRHPCQGGGLSAV
jgi:hypothetical protein